VRPARRGPWWRGPAPSRAGETAVRTRGVAGGGGRALVCADCGHRVASTADRIEVEDAHEHTRKNPHGHVHRFGCFARAPGCEMRGGPSTEWPWFDGFAWEIAVCRRCGLHLGWRFSRGDDAFWGLITKRVAEMDDDRAT
jgi:hypothetical protein